MSTSRFTLVWETPFRGTHPIEWDFQDGGDLTVQSIHQRYEGENVRISVWCSQPGNVNAGISRGGVWYVVKGKCEVTFASGDVVRCPSDGKVFKAPAGKYSINTLGEKELNILMVFHLDSLL